jgi:apolipoprotein N-acyltransferase
LGLALRSSAAQSRWMILLAAVIASSVNFHYYQLVMPLPAAVLVVLLQALVWLFVTSAARGVILRGKSAWTVLAYPMFWVAIDNAMARFLPDGNWASLAYTQADFLPMLQLTSVLGIAGLLFVLTLVPSVLAVTISSGGRLPGTGLAVGLTLAVVAASLGFGMLRLQQPLAGTPVRFGLAAIDDAIGPAATAAYTQGIQHRYDAQIAALAQGGAQIVLLPEKIAVLAPAVASEWQQHFAAQAATHKLWLIVGMAVHGQAGIANDAWLFSPGGALSVSYQKHHLAPPERSYLSGDAYAVQPIDGINFGLAICKDMHFASLGREYALRKADVMLVPAWDFGLDRWMGSRMTATRGVENGYLIVRAAREGLLTISDSRGRVLAEQTSNAMPGAMLLSTISVSAATPTFYARWGNVFGWLCTAAALLMSWYSRRTRPQSTAAPLPTN